MRIAYVCHSYPPRFGGVETHVSEIATRLAGRGHVVEVLTVAEGPAEVERSAGVTVRRFRVIRLAGNELPRGLRRYLSSRRGDWDVVHAHSHASPPAVAAALAPTGPLVFTPHFHGFSRSLAARAYSAAIRPAASLVLRSANRVICVSEAEERRLAGHFPYVADRIVVIPNGTSRSWRARPADGSGSPLILSLGRLQDYKNVDAVIAALAHLPPELKLHVIGDGAARPALAARAASEGIPERVEFLGHVDDQRVDRALSESNVLVTMSSLEAFGLATLDALAAGLPVVASDIPAHRELRDRFGGDRITLVPLDAQPNELARAIAQTAAGGHREPPGNLPTWDRVADLTLGVYHSVVGDARGG